MFFLCRLWIWCKRFRHRCGYGVHSPSDFFLITSIIYERSPYYAYRTLKKRGFSNYLPHYRRKVNRLLFRLVNYFRPKSLIEVGIGNGASISYMRAASRTMDSVTLKGRDRDKTLLQLTKSWKNWKASIVCTLHILLSIKRCLKRRCLMCSPTVGLSSEEFTNHKRSANGGKRWLLTNESVLLLIYMILVWYFLIRIVINSII